MPRNNSCEDILKYSADASSIEVLAKNMPLDDLLSLMALRNDYPIQLDLSSNQDPTSLFVTDYPLEDIFKRIQFIDVVNSGLKTINDEEQILEILLLRNQTNNLSWQANIAIMPYVSMNSIREPNDPINVNLIIKNYLAVNIALQGKSNLPIIPVINVIAMGSELASYDIITQYVDLSKPYVVQVTEYSNGFTKLDEYLRENPPTAQTIGYMISQLIEGLYQICLTLPGFRYGQMYPEGLFCSIEQETQIPILKLANYYLSRADNIENNAVIKDSFIDDEIAQGYFDLYTFLNYMWNHYEEEIILSEDLLNLFSQLLPVSIRSKNDLYLATSTWRRLTPQIKAILNIKVIRDSEYFDRNGNIKEGISGGYSFSSGSESNENNENANVDSKKIIKKTIDKVIDKVLNGNSKEKEEKQSKKTSKEKIDQNEEDNEDNEKIDDFDDLETNGIKDDNEDFIDKKFNNNFVWNPQMNNNQQMYSNLYQQQMHQQQSPLMNNPFSIDNIQLPLMNNPFSIDNIQFPLQAQYATQTQCQNPYSQLIDPYCQNIIPNQSFIPNIPVYSAPPLIQHPYYKDVMVQYYNSPGVYGGANDKKRNKNQKENNENEGEDENEQDNENDNDNEESNQENIEETNQEQFNPTFQKQRPYKPRFQSNQQQFQQSNQQQWQSNPRFNKPFQKREFTPNQQFQTNQQQSSNLNQQTDQDQIVIVYKQVGPNVIPIQMTLRQAQQEQMQQAQQQLLRQQQMYDSIMGKKIIIDKHLNPLERARIVEMILPTKNNFLSFDNIGERLITRVFLRHTLLNSSDGEEISIMSDFPKVGVKNIWSYMKPISFDSKHWNKYVNTPGNFNVISAVLPIRFNEKLNTVVPTDSSFNVNLRLYALSCAELGVFEDIHRFKLTDYYDVWREVKYYESITHTVLEQRICPNFPLYYAWFISKISLLDYARLVLNNDEKTRLFETGRISEGKQREFINKQIENMKTASMKKFLVALMKAQQNPDTSDDVYRNNFIEYQNALMDRYRKIANQIDPITRQQLQLNPLNPVEQDGITCGNNNISSLISSRLLPDEMDPALKGFSGSVLVLVTERAIYPFYEWISTRRELSKDGLVERTLQNGFYNDNVWIYSLFQILTGMLALYQQGIYIKNMSIAKNIFVEIDSKPSVKKDKNAITSFVNNPAKGSTYYIQKIKNINYYIPNLGFKILIDNSFNAESVIALSNMSCSNNSPLSPECSRDFLIESNSLDFDPVTSSMTNENIRKGIEDNFASIFSRNSFSRELLKNGVNRPSERILNLLDSINSHINLCKSKPNEYSLKDIPEKFFVMLMNNRIGTIVRNEEKKFIDTNPGVGLTKGALIAYQEAAGVYKWCQISNNNNDNILESLPQLQQNVTTNTTNTNIIRILTSPRTFKDWKNINYKQLIEIPVDRNSLFNYIGEESVRQNNVDDISFHPENLGDSFDLIL